MAHLGFVLAAYGVAAVALVGLVAAILIDQRVQKKALRDLEKRGMRRRSERARSPAS
jgi:heme exporter protein D